MDRENIIKLAREAGCIGPDEGGDPNGLWEPKGHENVTELMMTFAALVAAAEREACAKVCEERQEVFQKYYTKGLPAMCAEAIRARGNT